MKLNLSVDEVLSTTRAVRKRLDMSKPVPRARSIGMRKRRLRSMVVA